MQMSFMSCHQLLVYVRLFLFHLFVCLFPFPSFPGFIHMPAQHILHRQELPHQHAEADSYPKSPLKAVVQNKVWHSAMLPFLYLFFKFHINTVFVTITLNNIRFRCGMNKQQNLNPYKCALIVCHVAVWSNALVGVYVYFSPCFRRANTADEGTFLQDTSSLQYQPGSGEGAQEQTRGNLSCLSPLCCQAHLYIMFVLNIYTSHFIYIYIRFLSVLPLLEICIFCMFSFLLQLYKEQRRSCDNVSHKSSDSDVSDVSAISRASSASRISSTSYMSIQSEQPRGHFRSAAHTKTLHNQNCAFCSIFPLLFTIEEKHKSKHRLFIAPSLQFLIILWGLLAVLIADYVVMTPFFVYVYSKLKYLYI